MSNENENEVKEFKGVVGKVIVLVVASAIFATVGTGFLAGCGMPLFVAIGIGFGCPILLTIATIATSKVKGEVTACTILLLALLFFAWKAVNLAALVHMSS